MQTEKQTCRYKVSLCKVYHTEGKISIEYCPTANIVADVLTKPVTKAKLERFK